MQAVLALSCLIGACEAASLLSADGLHCTALQRSHQSAERCRLRRTYLPCQPRRRAWERPKHSRFISSESGLHTTITCTAEH